MSPRAELASVGRVAIAVVVGVWLYLAAQPRAGTDAANRQQKNLLPFQSLVQTHGPEDQRMFRSLQVALLEAQNVRSTTARWPDVPSLAGQGIEPFALDPTAKGARYEWRMLQNGLYVNYLGIPDRGDAQAWLLLIQEPDPSAPPEAYQNDEDHARLLDGTLLHVSIWQHANGARVPTAPVRLPQAAGWMQLFAVGPSASH